MISFNPDWANTGTSVLLQHACVSANTLSMPSLAQLGVPEAPAEVEDMMPGIIAALRSAKHQNSGRL